MPQTQPHSDAFTIDEQGLLRSTVFDDIYFSVENGLEESEYVFLQGNDLPKRLQALKENAHFTIAETGFGTGLNFLSLWRMWQEYAPKTACLHYYSVEKHPLPVDILALALAPYTEIATFSEQLITNYPTLQAQGTLSWADERVNIHVLYDDISLFGSYLTQHKVMADAWFLDGFAPQKNPDMWCQSLFDAMSHHTKTHGTVATFTAAGKIKRALIEAGFNVHKQAGYGRKREMITAIME